jgi:sugar phosphate isomerase/epimerase
MLEGAPKIDAGVTPHPLHGRLGLNVPYGWWPAAPLLKGFEAGGFAWAQIPSPPEEVLCSPHECHAHARATGAALGTTGLEAALHGPGRLRAGTPAGDRCFDGLLSYAAEIGARVVVYHARDLPDEPGSEDRQLAETRSLGRLASRAEKLGTVIALENLAPVYPGPEQLSHTPMVLRSLVHKLSSPALALCLDLGHAHVVSDLRHSDISELIEPVLDSVELFHLHDNLGARRGGRSAPELDPLRLDLHLPPGRGTMPWQELAPRLRAHQAPMLLEVHPPHRGSPEKLREAALAVLGVPEAVGAAA